jgi:polysaccharide export outer membrane protein
MENMLKRIHAPLHFVSAKVARQFSLFFVLGILLFYSSSCVSYKNQIFFQGLNDTTYTASMQQPELVIQRGDQLAINVYTTDPLAATYYNQPMGGQAGGNNMLQNVGQSNGTIIGYLVDEKGEITFPKLGNINVLGLTQQNLQDTILGFVKPYAKDAVVSVRLLNFRVTFINANKASTVTILNNKTNILQFFGIVGGVDWMDKRDDLMLIRQVNDQRTVYRLNLTDKSIFSSPAFYLQPNDVVYVEPNKRKFLETNAQLISVFTGVMSAFSIILVLFNTVF